jgi:hypothetical protein
MTVLCGPIETKGTLAGTQIDYGALMSGATGIAWSEKLRKALGPIKLEISPEEHHRRIRYALSLGFHSMSHLVDKCLGERIVICGSGPSLRASLPRLRTFGGKIIACNASHDFLIKNGVKPWAGVIMDPHDWCESYQTPTPGVGYFMGTTVHAKVWQRFREAGVRPWVFIPVMDDEEHKRVLETYENDACFLAGATTVGLRTINLALHLGASVVECHGLDSCYAPGQDGLGSNQLHAHSKPHVDHDARVITLASKATGDRITCISNGAMSRQIIGYNSVIESLPKHISNGRIGKARLVVAGDGAIPWMAWKDGGPNEYVEHLDPAAMQAKYGNAGHWDYYANKPYMEKAA